MDAKALTESLREHLEMEGAGGEAVERILSFEDAGIYSSAPGLVIEMADGSVFQVTSVQVRYAPESRNGKSAGASVRSSGK